MAPKADPALVQRLAAVPIFSSLGEKALKSIASDAKERRFGAGEKLVSKGDKGVGFFLILDGHVEVRNGATVLATLGPSQFFGEMALLDDQPRTADVVAKTAGNCLVVSRWEFWGYLSKEPETIRLLLQETVRRLRTPVPGFSE